MLMPFLCSSALALYALIRRALTPAATATAWVMCLVMSVVGGMTAFFTVAAVLLLTVIADRISYCRADPNGLRKKRGMRDCTRVMCNLSVSFASILALGMTRKEVFMAGFSAAMAESLADSLASKIGPLSKKQPIDICRLRRTSTGLSGGVTLLGTLAELFGAALAAGVYFIGRGRIVPALAVLAAGFLGAVFDSVLGSIVQVKYRCPVCGAVSERQYHCDARGSIESGFAFINNDTVNLLSNFSSLLLAFLILWE